MSARRPSSAPPSERGEAAEPTLAERFARAVTLAQRGRRYVAGALLITALGLGASAFAALHAKRTYASECTLALRSLQRETPSEAENLTRKTARLRDMLAERGRLEGTIRKFGLYPRIVEDRDILEAVETMRTHVGLRARESGRFVVSFDSEEMDGTDTRTLVREVTQHLADSLADDWVGGGLKELRNEATFLDKELKTANTEIDDAIGKVTVFLGAHPEFAAEVQPGGVGLSAVGKPGGGAPAPAPSVATDPTLNALRRSDPTLAELWREYARLDADLKAVPSPAPSPSAIPAPTNTTRDDAVRRVEAAKKRYAEAQADLQSKQTRLTEEHPDMKVSQAAVATAATELREARAQLAAVDAAATPAPAPGTAPSTAPAESPESKRLREVRAQIGAREAQLLAAAKSSAPAPSTAPSLAPPAPLDAGPPETRASLETEWQRLLRTLGEAKTKHDAVVKRYETVQFNLKSSEVAKGDLVTVIEPAYRPMKPSKSRRWLIAILGAFSSIAAGLAWIFARVRLDGRILDAGDVEELRLGPVLGAVPRAAPPEAPETTAMVRAEPDPLVSYVEETAAPFDQWPIKVVRMVASPRSADVLAFLHDEAGEGAALRVIRHKLELLHGEGLTTFAVTSPHAGDGKSVVATMLAMALSESQRARVLLVEGNLRKPSIAQRFGLDLPRDFGISGQLVAKIEGEGHPWQVVAIGPALHVLAESPHARPVPRVIQSGHFLEALSLFGELYDYVVVDGPHVLGTGDANALETAVEGVVVVARREVSTKADLRKAVRQIGTRRLVGFVLLGGELET
jgi:Mrp family chromosome partitioning ATPase